MTRRFPFAWGAKRSSEPSAPSRSASSASAVVRPRPPQALAGASDQESTQISVATISRVGWFVGSVLVVFWGLQLWVGSTSVGWANPVSLVVVLGGLLLGVWVFVDRQEPRWLTQTGIMLLLAVSIGAWAYLQVLRQPAYGTDELAFDQYAAHLLLHGANPYVHSMLPALQRFLVPPIYHTYLLSGGEVSRLSYPALAFLLYLPSLLAGLRMQAAVATDVVAWAAAFLLLWRLLPPATRWLAAVLFGFQTYIDYVVGGVTDALFLPFLLLALWRWDRYGDPRERTAARWLSPIALGLAASIKQTPWFVLPFLLIGLANESRARGKRWFSLPARYLVIALVPFLLINLPFIVAGARAWLHGVMLPLVSPTVPGGQGVVNLSLFEQSGGNLRDYTVAGGLALCLALVAFGLYYGRLKRAFVPLLAVVFFWPTRSFATYLIDLAPAALIGALTVRPAASLPLRLPRGRHVVAGVLVVAFLLAITRAVTADAPLQLAIMGTRSTGQLRTISAIDLQVKNTTGRSLHPHIAVINGGYLTTFWYGSSPSLTVPAHGTKRLILHAPNAQSMPSIDGGFVVEAFTASPATLSASAIVPPTARQLVITPNAINSPMRVGRSRILTVRAVDRLGNAVRRAAIPVALGQVVYGQHALIPGEASIDGRPEGETPVFGHTDRSGRVQFTIRGIQAQSDPVFFQAWIAPRDRAPSGFSNLVSILFVDR